jgi:hypothetical protein
MPFWLLVPCRLDEAFRSRRTRGGGPAALADILWGQYCLFQCIRLQDDVFDGHATDLALVYAANQFLVEAESAFAKCLPRTSRFWGVFWKALESTTQAIVRVDAMQKRIGCDPARLAREYARVAAVLKVGTAAVCFGRRRTRDLAALGRFADSYAMADQILDDLDDVAEDLRRRRFNYVAQRLCGGRVRRLEVARRAIARALVSGEGGDLILGDARRHLARAAATADGLDLPALRDYAAQAGRALDSRRRALHRTRLELVFGQAHRPGSPVL